MTFDAKNIGRGFMEKVNILEKRKEMAIYQRKITTQIFTVWEYDIEIAAIEQEIKLLKQNNS